MPPRPRALSLLSPAALAVAAVLLLAACSVGDSNPSAAPSPSAPPAPAARSYLGLGDSVAAGVGADDPRHREATSRCFGRA